MPFTEKGKRNCSMSLFQHSFKKREKHALFLKRKETQFQKTQPKSLKVMLPASRIYRLLNLHRLEVTVPHGS